MSKLPVVAIVGRANVGKSSVFNRLVNKRQAVVAREAGTTRDAVRGRVEHDGYHFLLIDTAGFKRPEDEFEMTIQDQIAEATAGADLILVVVEAAAQVSDEDRRVAKLALKSKKPVLLIINKADTVKVLDEAAFGKLGVKELLATSATQGQGFSAVLAAIVQQIPKYTSKTVSGSLSVALVGRPNVGKSYLFNALAKKQQAIVADTAGTTRDVNRAEVRYHGKTLHLLDTAGIRRAGRIERGVERFSVVRALAAIEEADICLLVMDVSELNAKLDQKIAGLVKEAGRGLILVVSKWDSADKDAFTRDELAKQIAHEYQFVAWAPLIFTSAITGQNVADIYDLVLEIDQARTTELATKDLNRWLEARVTHHAPSGLKNKQPRLKYMTQTDTRPPTFDIFGRSVEYVHWSYTRYLERELRESYGFAGTPVRLRLREKQ